MTSNPKGEDHIEFLIRKLWRAYEGTEQMSNVMWCDLGDHPFKAGSEGSGSFTGTQNGPNGTSHQARLDYCADHRPGTFRALPTGPQDGVDESPDLYRENG